MMTERRLYSIRSASVEIWEQCRRLDNSTTSNIRPMWSIHCIMLASVLMLSELLETGLTPGSVRDSQVQCELGV